jgi:hypothetical protein
MPTRSFLPNVSTWRGHKWHCDQRPVILQSRLPANLHVGATSPPPTCRPLLRPPDGPPACIAVEGLLHVPQAAALCCLCRSRPAGGPAALRPACLPRLWMHVGLSEPGFCLLSEAPLCCLHACNESAGLKRPGSHGREAALLTWLIGMLHSH